MSKNILGKLNYTKETYEEKYKSGYGVNYPEGHVIRFYNRVLKYELNIEGGRILDFGCGNGVHSKYFTQLGFKTFGVDVAKDFLNSIRSWKKDGVEVENYHLIEPGADITNIFCKNFFDIIFANQSLYYLDNSSLKNTVNQMYELTKEDGLIFASMMSTKNCYFNNVKSVSEDGLREVVLSNRLKETTYINFVDSPEELENIFKPYKKLHIAEYNPYGNIECSDEDGCGHHYIFIGKKVTN